MKAKAANVLSPRDLDLIRKYLMGGAALGGSAALVTSLNNHVNTLQQEQDNSSKDDDTIYLNLPAKQAVVGGGLALAGGALATLGSYAAVRKAYQAIKRKRLQSELDEAQNVYLDTTAQEGKSAATKPMGMVEMLTSAPIAVPILLGLGSGALAHKFLDETFPGRKRRQTTGPRRVVLRETPPQKTPEEQAAEEESMKIASDDSGCEFLIHTILGNAKAAAAGDLKDLVSAAAQGRCGELELAFDNDPSLAPDLVKGASERSTSLPFNVMATSFLVKSAVIGPSIKLMAAAEYAEMAPTMFKLAGELDQTTADALIGMVNIMGAAVRHDIMSDYIRVPEFDKEASEVPQDQGVILRRFLDHANDVPESTMDSSTSEDNKDEAEQEKQEKEKHPAVLAQGFQAEKFKEKNQDLIDQVLTP